MENLIYDYLVEKCVGYDNRVKANVLMAKFGITDNKTFRKKIQNIRDDEHYPRLIGSEAGKNGGYWIIANLVEYYRTAHHLCARSMEMEHTFEKLEEKFRNEKGRGF